MTNPIKFFVHLVKNDQLTCDHKRELHMIVIACLLNLSFALEKFSIVLGCNPGDLFWGCVYFSLCMWLAWVVAHDYLWDVWEDYKNKTNQLSKSHRVP